MRTIWLISLALPLIAARGVAGESFLNLDFEQTTSAGRAKHWIQRGPGYEVAVDAEVAKKGAKSLRMRRLREGAFGVATGTFPLEDAAGKRVRYTGFIKTDAVGDGWAGLWWRVDGQSGLLAFDNMNDRGAKGTTPWTQYTVELDVDPAAKNINFGVLLTGSGTAWFDGLQVELDGAVYKQVAPVPFVANEKQLDWLRQQAVPFDSADPQADLDDLEPLKQIVGDARIVALGEATHGTREFFQMKHRITRFLAERMGFTVFAIEANMPEARRVNRYVLTGEGDPREALSGLYFWTWNTQEVLDMIEWMRRFNASGAGRIEFWGFDMQFPEVAIDEVREFVGRADPEYVDSLAAAYDKVRESRNGRRARGRADTAPFKTWHEAAGEVFEHLRAGRESYLKKFDAQEVDWAIQNARIVLQAGQTLVPGQPSRDRSMADNVDWILAHTPPDTKIVLWAHNGHVSRGGQSPAMGQFLHQRHGAGQVVVGFAFHEGEYTAIGDRGLDTYGTSASGPGSVEWALHQSGLPRLLLDLRRIDARSPDSSWLARQLDFRSIGALALEDGFYARTVVEEFDVLVYFDQTRPSVVLTSRRQKPQE